MITETPPLQPIVPAYHLDILSHAQLDQLQSATLEILEQTGVHCPSEKALDIYAEHGGKVDFEHQIVRLPPEVVLAAMAHAPRHYTLGARLPAFDLSLDGTGALLRHRWLRGRDDRLRHPPAAPVQKRGCCRHGAGGAIT